VVAKPVVVKPPTKSKRKPAAKLNDIGSELYSVLVPQHGYMKIDGGEPYFYDNLPRASASFMSYADAQAALYRAIVILHTKLTETKKDHDEWVSKGWRDANSGYDDNYYYKRLVERLELATNKAKIVKLIVNECSSN
jgi:hypothetical protein